MCWYVSDREAGHEDNKSNQKEQNQLHLGLVELLGRGILPERTQRLESIHHASKGSIPDRGKNMDKKNKFIVL